MEFRDLLVLGMVITCYAQYQYPLRPIELENLVAEPGYRGVRLSWRYYQTSSEPIAFTLKICEQSSWRLKRPCKSRYLSTDGSKQKQSSHDVLKHLDRGRYVADVYELRTLTNYTFSLEPTNSGITLRYPNDQKARFVRSKTISALTKPFAARAVRCLGNSTDVEVQTGSFFGGKITVDQTYDTRCSLVGNPNSPNGTYTLTIPHKICGSKVVNNSRIETDVIVHENRELITHNSRKFHVICNFVADGFTVKATVEVLNVKPREEKTALEPVGFGTIEAEPNEIYDERQDSKGNNVGDSRFRAEQFAFVQEAREKSDEFDSFGVTIAVCLTSLFVVVLVAVAFYLRKPRCRNKSRPLESSTEEKSRPSEKTVVQDDQENLVVECSFDISFTETTCKPTEEIQVKNETSSEETE